MFWWFCVYIYVHTHTHNVIYIYMHAWNRSISLNEATLVYILTLYACLSYTSFYLWCKNFVFFL